MEWKMLLNGLFALGGIAALAFLAYGGSLALRYTTGFIGEGIGRFAHRHRRRVRQAPRVSSGQRA